jgi:hypothetical protein
LHPPSQSQELATASDGSDQDDYASLLTIDALPASPEPELASAANLHLQTPDTVTAGLDPLDVLFAADPHESVTGNESRDFEVREVDQSEEVDVQFGLRPDVSAEFDTISGVDDTQSNPAEKDRSALAAVRSSAREAGPSLVVSSTVDRDRTRRSAYLQIECPVCRSLGVVSIDRLHRQMTCKLCGTLFFMDRVKNKIVVGMLPEQLRRDPTGGARKSAGLAPLPGEKTLKRWRSRLQGRRSLLRLGFGTAALGLLSWYGIAALSKKPAVANQVLDRSNYVALALLRNTPSRVQNIASSSTRGDARRWFYKARPEDWPDSDANASIRPEVLYCRVKGKEGCVRVEISLRRSEHPVKLDSRSRGTTLMLFWSLSNEGLWEFDGTKSLKLLESESTRGASG